MWARDPWDDFHHPVAVVAAFWRVAASGSKRRLSQKQKMFVGKLGLTFVMLEVYPLNSEGIKSMRFGRGLIPSFRGTFF